MKVLFVITEDWYFVSHRLPLAIEAQERGWDVLLVCRAGECRVQLEDLGIRVVHVDVDRGGINPSRDVGYLRALKKVYRAEKPDIVHHVTMKPCLYGSLAAWWAKTPSVVNALAGLGFLFSSERLSIKLIRRTLMQVFRRLFNRKNSLLILQNPDDVSMMLHRVGVMAERIRLIRGSGVDLEMFCPANDRRANKLPVCVMVSRLLRDKGVMELIDAARLLQKRGCGCRIVLVGDADLLNPNAVDQRVLDEAVSDGSVECWGRRSDIAKIYQEADIAILPSYREGLPKTLVEAAACGLPIITTDTPGCREVVCGKNADGWEPRGVLKVGANGILVPPKEVVPIADAIEWLVGNAAVRSEMGLRSRELAEQEFDVKQVVEKTFCVYEELLKQDENNGKHGRKA